MRFGITGNTQKEGLWNPVADLVSILEESAHSAVLHPNIEQGLLDRDLISKEAHHAESVEDFFERSDVILSFGGDGTLLNTVAELGAREIPILGVNHGHLGFLANVEGAELVGRIENLANGDYVVDHRLVLHAELDSARELMLPYALNEFTIQRSGDAGLLAINVEVDNIHLNTYWADGLIISTPTGSTAYSMALGGPIMAPGCGSILITPIAPHALSVRPVVIPDTSVIRVKTLDANKSHILTSDGVNEIDALKGDAVTVCKASHHVHLIRFPDQEYFSTLRTKLMWGTRKSS